jgi:microcystin degradation protein MlrC
MLVPPEAQTPVGPFGELRALADKATTGDVLDISLFPVQPWLDVEGLGFAVTVTTDAAPDKARRLAEHIAEMAWRSRHAFTVELVDPVEALDRVRASRRCPALLSESADSPTAGATGDSPAMLRVLLEHGRDLRAYATVVDVPAVAACFGAGIGALVGLRVGCSYDHRFHRPVPLHGVVRRLGSGPFALTGPIFTGMEVSMGRWAVVDAGNLSVLLTERPAYTFDPETFRQVALPPEAAVVIVVRSVTLFRAGWAGLAGDIFILDLPGASTPNLATLSFARAPRPLYPLEDL